MGLSYTGKSCLEMPRVLGYRRVPKPPARRMPFISAFRVQAALGKLKKQPASLYLKNVWAIGIAESSKSSLHALLRERAGCF